MKNRILIAFFLLAGVCLAPRADAQCTPVSDPGSPSWQVGMKCTFTSTSSPFQFNAASIGYWQIYFVPSGTVSGATLSLDSSATGSSFTTGGILAAATIGAMTSAGNYANSSATTPTNFGQLTPTITGSGSVTVAVLGYRNNPATSGSGGGITSVASGTGLTGGPITTSGTLSIQNLTGSSLGFIRVNGGTIAVNGLPIDGSAGWTSAGSDPCAQINTNITNSISTFNAVLDIQLGNWGALFPNGIPCLSNPFEAEVFSGRIDLGATYWVKSVPWVTPGGNQRTILAGVGTSDVGTAIGAEDTVIQDCGPEAPGWTGTVCSLTAASGSPTISVPAFGSSGHSVTTTYPHGALPAGTWYPTLWLGAMGPSNVTLGGAFGCGIQDITVWPGSGGGNIGILVTGCQEQSYCKNVTVRAANNFGFLFDRAEGTATGPSHLQLDKCTARMDDLNTAAQGYPVVGSTPMGYGIFYEGNADQIWFSGGTCTKYPQGFPSAFSAGAISTITMTYAGSCPNVTGLTCHVGSNRGTSGTCGITTSGNTVTGITVTAGGSGYGTADQAGGGFKVENATINGDNTKQMQNAVVLDGCLGCTLNQLHGGYDADFSFVIGYGSGVITGGFFVNNDFENTSKGSYHLGVGIDNTQVLLATGKGGSVGPVQDDQNNFTASASVPCSIYDPGTYNNCNVGGVSAFTNATVSTVPVTVNAITGQTSDLQDWEVASGSPLASVSAAGAITALSFAGAVAATTLSASSTVSGTGFSTYLASPPAIGSTAASTGAFTALSASSTVSGTGFTALFSSPTAFGNTAPSTVAATSFTAGTNKFSVSAAGLPTQSNSKTIVGQGFPIIVADANQVAETGTAANILSYTPSSAAGDYEICVSVSVSSATSGVIAWTLSWKDSNSNAQANIAMPLFQFGTAAPNTTFTTSAAGNYYGCATVDIDNSGTAIVPKWVGGGTTAAKVSATVKEMI